MGFKQFLLDLVLPRFSKLDFFNLFIYGLVAFIVNPDFFNLFTSDAMVFALFFLGLCVVFGVKSYSRDWSAQHINDNKKKPFDWVLDAVKGTFYIVACLALAAAVFIQLSTGYLTLRMNTLWETLLTIFSIWVLLQMFVLMILIRISKNVTALQGEFQKRVDERVVSKNALFLGLFLTVVLYWLCNFWWALPDPLISIPLVFLVDSIVFPIEKLVWVKN